MAYPVAGSPAVGTVPTTPYSGTFIPEIWHGETLEKFYSATVLAAIANTTYEGEVRSKGDKVYIRTVPTITVRTHTDGAALITERPSAPNVILLIDKGAYFSCAADDVIRAQSDLALLDMYTKDASNQLKINIDTAVLATLTAGIVAANKGDVAGRISANINLGKATAPITVAAGGMGGTGVSSAMEVLTNLAVVLDEQNAPPDGRWAVIPAWFKGLLMNSPLANASWMGDGTSVYRNGRLGEVAGFTLYESNLLPTAVESTKTAFHIYAGHSKGLTFASQLTEVETLRMETAFGTILRGLQVYGSKVVDGTLLADAYVVK